MRIYNVVTKNSEGKYDETTILSTSRKTMEKDNPGLEFIRVTDITKTVLTDDAAAKIGKLLSDNGYSENEVRLVSTLIQQYLNDRVDGRGKKEDTSKDAADKAQETSAEQPKEETKATAKRGKNKETAAA